MAYTKKTWVDFPDTSTPITADDLNNIEDALAGMLDYFYPVGTIYETTSTDLDTTTKMANHFGGTWEAYGSGKVLVAKSSDTEFDTIDETGGTKTHQLSVAEMPSHTHGVLVEGQGGASAYALIVKPTGAAGSFNSHYINTNGSGTAHNNLQPYIVVYRYRRTA